MHGILAPHTSGRLALIALMLLGTSLLARPVHAAAHQARSQGTCQTLSLPVALAPGEPPSSQISGQLCQPTENTGKLVQVLISGATYGHLYWDFPYQPQTYSYVQAMNAAGYSTLNIDRLGTGLSSHPDLSLVDVTMETAAYVVHEIIQELRTGLIGGQTFTHVLLVGHSLGSGVVWLEAGTYHDVDGAIITGLVHHLNTAGLDGILLSFYPADLDPRFAHSGFGPGYLTTQPGTRAADFYSTPNADPHVIALDEATKETTTDGEARTFAPLLLDGISGQITVPVLLVVGQQDSIVCGQDATDCTSAATIQQAEAPYYASQAQLQVALIANSGHALALHYAAPLYFAATIAWIQQAFGP